MLGDKNGLGQQKHGCQKSFEKCVHDVVMLMGAKVLFFPIQKFPIFAGMKRVCFIGLLFVLTACRHSPVETQNLGSPEAVAHPALQAIDSLMWQQPDSALAELQEYFTHSDTWDASDFTKRRKHCFSTTYNGHYAQLLASELLYKNYYEQTNRAKLQQAVSYFDSLVMDGSGTCGVSLPFLNARAHYINGVGYYERDSVVEACAEYLKALEAMEKCFDEKELVGERARFMALTYTHLTRLFSDQYLHEQAICFGKLSLSFYQKYNATLWHIAWMLNEIGSNYDMKEELDSADCYYRKAIDVLDDTSTLMYRDILAHQAFLEYKKDCHKANAAISSLLRLLSETENENERITRYSYIGEILFHEKQLDSAWAFLSIVFQETSDISLKKQSAERLVEICKVQPRDERIIEEYVDFLVPYANQEENKSEIKSQLTEFYKTFIQERLEQQHHKETRRHLKQASTVIIGMLFVILIISLLYHKNRKHKQNLETLIESERQAHKMQQAALAGRLRRSNAALKGDHRNPTHTKDSLSSSHRHNSSIVNYEEEPICQHILSMCNDKKNPIKSTVPVAAYANISLNDTQKAQLKDAAMYHYGSMFEKLKQQHPELKEKDFQYCYLCLLGLDNIQIAVLLQNSISTIWEREKRLKKVLGSEDRIAVILHGCMIN